MSTSNILFQQKFDVVALNDTGKELDKGESGKKFERVNRLTCRNSAVELEMIIDVNCEMFNARAGMKLDVAMASSLTDQKDDGHYDPTAQMSAFVDNYSYVMHGRVFSIKHLEKQNIELQASFGGLLMKLKGEQKDLERFSVDMMFYILMKITK